LSLPASLWILDRHREDVVVSPDSEMTGDALTICEVQRVAIRLQVSTDPSAPAPSRGGVVLLAISNH
jgi:hypothetical protein